MPSFISSSGPLKVVLANLSKFLTYSKRRLDCLLKIFLFLLRLLLALIIDMNLFIKYSYHLVAYKYSYSLLAISSFKMMFSNDSCQQSSCSVFLGVYLQIIDDASIIAVCFLREN